MLSYFIRGGMHNKNLKQVGVFGVGSFITGPSASVSSCLSLLKCIVHAANLQQTHIYVKCSYWKT